MLDPVAEREGVKSTTRYRSKPNKRAVITKYDPPSGGRQNSGRLGGQRTAGRFRGHKQKHQVKSERSERSDNRRCGKDAMADYKHYASDSTLQSVKCNRSPTTLKFEDTDSATRYFLESKQDPLAAFGNVKGIFEDLDLSAIPPFVDDSTCLSRVPEVMYDYPF